MLFQIYEINGLLINIIGVITSPIRQNVSTIYTTKDIITIRIIIFEKRTYKQIEGCTSTLPKLESDMEKQIKWAIVITEITLNFSKLEELKHSEN